MNLDKHACKKKLTSINEQALQTQSVTTNRHHVSNDDFMRNIDNWNPQNVRFVFTDIDDTLTTDGRLIPSAYQSLWDIHNKGIHVIPVTGRPAGWCELIARQWPVSGVIGENGGFYFRYRTDEKKMIRHFFFSQEVQIKNRMRLNDIRKEVLHKVPGCAVASDQFTRLMDLAIDFCEDVKPLPEKQIQQIVQLFIDHGAQAKVSSIHVNGWYGDYNKLSMTKEFLKREFSLNLDEANETMVFIGDSPNDEPMFAAFENSLAVANINDFKDKLEHPPKFVCRRRGGKGFAEFAHHLLTN